MGVLSIGGGVGCGERWNGCRPVWMQASLRRLHIMSKGLKNFGQESVGQVMVVTHWGSGRGAQVASGASVLSRRVMGGCMAWLFARVKWIGCQWWEGCPGVDDLTMPFIGQIECGRVARGSISCSAMFRRWVQCCGLMQDMMLVWGIQCPDGSICWGGFIDQLLHHGEADHWFWRVGWGIFCKEQGEQ